MPLLRLLSRKVDEMLSLGSSCISRHIEAVLPMDAGVSG